MPEPTRGGQRPPAGDPDHTWVMLKSARSSCTALSTSSADGRSWEPPAPREKPPYLGVWGEPGASKRSPAPHGHPLHLPAPPQPHLCSFTHFLVFSLEEMGQGKAHE